MISLSMLLFGLNYGFCRDLQVFSYAVTNATTFIENRYIQGGVIEDEYSSIPGSYAVGFGQISLNLNGSSSEQANFGNLLQIQDILSSNVITESIANNNSATSSQYLASTGNIQLIDSIINSTLSSTGVTSNTYADGYISAYAGNIQQISDVANSTLFLTQRSQNNTAQTQTTEYSIAVSGNVQFIDNLENSTIEADFTAENNQATANGIAISGNEVYFGDIIDTDVELNIAALYNNAYSRDGDAIAGNRVTVAGGVGDGSEIIVTEFSFGNTAVANNGDAIIDFETNIPFANNTGRKLTKFFDH